MQKQIHPGFELKNTLDSLGWSQRDLSYLLEVSNSHINNILSGNRSITSEIAIKLEAADLGSARDWLHKQLEWDLAIVTEETSEETKAISLWQSIQKRIPLNYFKKHGLLVSDRSEDIHNILKVYKVNSVSEFNSMIDEYNFVHFRKSAAFVEMKENVVAWSMLAEYKVSQLECIGSFNKDSKDELVKKLQKLFLLNDGLNDKVKILLSQYGIKFDILDRPPKTPVDGKSFLSIGIPSIVLTSRYKRLDNFAFTLMHELGHVFLHLTKSKYREHSFFTNNTENDQLEFEANNFARNELISTKQWEDFLTRYLTYNDDAIEEYSNEIEVHQAIIRGRLCFEYPKYYRRKSRINDINKVL